MSVSTATPFVLIGDPEPLPPSSLMKFVEEMYVEYNAGAMTVDSHADAWIEARRRKVQTASDEVFLRQILYGAVRYKKFLKAFMAAFYFRNGSVASRSDVHTFTIWAYIALLRLSELTFSQFRRLALAQEPQKMLVLFAWLFKPQNLKDFCRDEWLKLYDVPFVEDVIATVATWKDDVAELMETLEEKVFLSKKKEEAEAGAWAAGSKSATGTVPVPFKLSEAKAKPLPANTEPPPPVKPKPIPASTYKRGPTSEQEAIETMKLENREKLVKLEPFVLKTTERPETLPRAKEQAEAELQATLRFDGTKAKPAPPPPAAAVRLNAAAVLREDALYKKKQAEEARMIAMYETELRDSVPFEVWQRRMKDDDEAERQEEIQRRRLDAVASGEAAIRIRKEAVEQKHLEVLKAREEARQKLALREEEMDVEREANKVRREIVIEERERVKISKEKLAMEKKKQADERLAERTEAEHLLAEIRAMEQKKKEDIIRQLRAIERVQDTSKKAVFDPTTMAGHGLLEEMTLTELQQRLQTVKRHRQEDEERQRAEIHRIKSRREDMILSKAENIKRIRDMANVSGTMRREERKEAERVRLAGELRAREDGMLVLRDKLHDKKMQKLEEQKRLAAEMKRIRFEQEIQAAGAAQLEEHKFKQLQKGAERELSHKQFETKEEAETYEKTRAKEWQIKLQNVRTEKREKREFLHNYNARVKVQQELTTAAETSKATRKKNLVSTEHTRLSTARGGFPANSQTFWVLKEEREHGTLPS